MAKKAPTSGGFQPGDPRINRKGRLPVGQSLAERVRAWSGGDGGKFVEFWGAIMAGFIPDATKDDPSSRVEFVARIASIASAASVQDRLKASQLLAERGFGKPKETQDHTGSITVRWQS